MKDHDKKDDTHLVTNNPAHTASREAADRARAGEPPDPQVGGTAPGTAASIGGAVGAAAVGAGMGTVIAGPIGAIVGIIAGALGGWWAGQGYNAASEIVPPEEEERYRRHFESAATRPADQSYESVRYAYLLGRLARRNPEYAGKTFAEIEPELAHAWTQDLWARYGSWAGVRRYVQAAYDFGGGA